MTRDPNDTDSAALYAAPFTVLEPPAQTRPFIFASPHSGRFYPAEFVAHSRLNALALRRSEDAFVDQLFACVAALGAPLIAARFPRAFVDANRAPGELDPGIFDGPLSIAVDAASPRVTAGLGVIPRVVRDGADIYREKLSPEEAPARLNGLYRPYHAALAQLIARTRARFGYAVLIDCHSMPSAAAMPDVIVGDRHGACAAPALTRFVEQQFETRGFTVARNTPYAGGHTTFLHGRSSGPVHALQLEINRGLYLDEEKIQPSPSFGILQLRLAEALKALVWSDLDGLGLEGAAQIPPLAAE